MILTVIVYPLVDYLYALDDFRAGCGVLSQGLEYH